MAGELADVKRALRVLHDDDDDLLERLISSATREYFKFIDDDDVTLPETEESSEPAAFVPEDAFNGIVLMVQADYDGDPLKRSALRDCAEALWMPYRKNIGP